MSMGVAAHCISACGTLNVDAMLLPFQSGNLGLYRPPTDFNKLMEQLTSPDWLARMSLPANLETLKVALAVRRDALELARLTDLQAHETAWSFREAEQRSSSLVHAQQVQTQLLQSQLAAQASELQRRLIEDAHAAVADAASVIHQSQAPLADGSPTSSRSSPAQQSSPRSMQLSPLTWQLEPSMQYPTVSAQLGALPMTSAAVALVPSATSD